jgi:multidrug transporter EmrE-like cation transporter
MLVLVAVALLWGTTNPFLANSSNTEAVGIMRQTIDLLKNWRFLLPLILNQCGSVLYNYALKSHPVSLAQPVANGLTLPVTALTAHLLGERPLKLDSLLGISLVLFGSWLCIL